MKLITSVQGSKAEAVARGAEKLVEEAGSPAGISVRENSATDQVTIVVDTDSLAQTAKALRQQAALARLQADKKEIRQLDAARRSDSETAQATAKDALAEKLTTEAQKATEEEGEARRQLDQAKSEKSDNERKRTSIKDSIEYEERKARELREEGQYKLSFATDEVQRQSGFDLLAEADIHLATASALRTGQLAPLERLADALKDNEDRISQLAVSCLERAQQAKSAGETARTDAGNCRENAKMASIESDSLKEDVAEARKQVADLESRASAQEAIAAAGNKTGAAVIAASA